MGLLVSERSLVLVIDVQGKLVGMVHRPELVLSATERLMRLADLFEVPVLLTEQYPGGLGPTHERLAGAFGALGVGHRRIEKDAFSCCAEPAFERALEELLPGVGAGRRQIVVAGIEAHVCVLQTVLALLDRGDAVHVCWECVSGRGEEYRVWALERMQQAGASITNHESVGFEWSRDRHHPRFRDLSQLLKEGLLA
jgi:nicotinamidase-related amidase